MLRVSFAEIEAKVYSKPAWLSASPSLYVQSDGQSCERFFANFFANTRHFVLRATGGCAGLEEKYYSGLETLSQVLSGLPQANKHDSSTDPTERQPRFSGFCLFGGTRMILKDAPQEYLPGITEVFPPLGKHCPEARILGIVAKAGHLRTTPFGLVVADEPENAFVTIIHPEQHSVLLLQPNVDSKADWHCEWRRCLDICQAHASNHWQGLLLVYNGGPVSEAELLTWAELGLTNDFYRVLLVQDSGGCADKYAYSEAFLKAHKNVFTCGNDYRSMQETLLHLQAIT